MRRMLRTSSAMFVGQGLGRPQHSREAVQAWHPTLVRKRQKTCNPARPLQESPGPSGPGIPKESSKESPKSLQRVSRGLPAPGSEKCPKQSRNSLRSLKLDCFETVSDTFRSPGPGRLFGDSLETLSGFRARRARQTPVTGRRGCNKRPESKGSRSQQRSVTDHLPLSDCTETQQNTNFGSFRAPKRGVTEL